MSHGTIWQPAVGTVHIHHDVIPARRERGVTDDQIDEMLVTTPRAWFERS